MDVDWTEHEQQQHKYDRVRWGFTPISGVVPTAIECPICKFACTMADNCEHYVGTVTIGNDAYFPHEISEVIFEINKRHNISHVFTPKLAGFNIEGEDENMGVILRSWLLTYKQEWFTRNQINRQGKAIIEVVTYLMAFAPNKASYISEFLTWYYSGTIVVGEYVGNGGNRMGKEDQADLVASIEAFVPLYLLTGGGKKSKDDDD